ncbi:hypothetical protein GF385_01400 [Candidatus Dependentiae bacterium]|nr:hypothetical protein [Candidatus Dependentiae bacterium]
MNLPDLDTCSEISDSDLSSSEYERRLWKKAGYLSEDLNVSSSSEKEQELTGKDIENIINIQKKLRTYLSRRSYSTDVEDLKKIQANLRAYLTEKAYYSELKKKLDLESNKEKILKSFERKIINEIICDKDRIETFKVLDVLKVLKVLEKNGLLEKNRFVLKLLNLLEIFANSGSLNKNPELSMVLDTFKDMGILENSEMEKIIGSLNKFSFFIIHYLENYKSLENLNLLFRKVEKLGLLKDCIDYSNKSKDANFLTYASGKCLGDIPNKFIVSSLLKTGLDPNFLSDKSTTPLNFMSLLSVEDLDPKIDKSLRKKISYFFKKELLDSLELMLKNGAKPNKKDLRGSFPLGTASFFGKPELVGKLLKYGADPNLQDSDGNTPLHLAVSFQSLTNVKVVRELLFNSYKKADKTIKNNDGKTPLDLLVKKLDKNILKMFLTKKIVLLDEYLKGSEELFYSITDYKNIFNSFKDVSSYIGYIEMIYMLLKTEEPLESLMDVKYLKRKLKKVLEKELISEDDILTFIKALKSYPEVFAFLSNRYRLVEEKLSGSSEQIRKKLSKYC